MATPPLETLRRARDALVALAMRDDSSWTGHCALCLQGISAHSTHTPDCIISQLDAAIAAPVDNAAAMRAALEPFAKAAGNYEHWAGAATVCHITVASLYAARDAYNAAPVGNAAAMRAALEALADDLDYTAAHFRDDEVRTMLEGMAADARAALDAAGEAGGGWRDIASAPKDGTRFLWCADNGEHTKCRWSYSVVRWPEYAECFTVGYWKPLDAPPLPTPPAEGGRDE